MIKFDSHEYFSFMGGKKAPTILGIPHHATVGLLVENPNSTDMEGALCTNTPRATGQNGGGGMKDFDAGVLMQQMVQPTSKCVGFDSFVFHWYSSRGDRNIMNHEYICQSVAFNPLIDWWFMLWSWFTSLPIMLTKIAKECQHTKTCQLVVLHETQHLFLWGLCKKSMKWASFTVILGHAKRSLGQCFFLVDEGHLFVPFKFWRNNRYSIAVYCRIGFSKV